MTLQKGTRAKNSLGALPEDLVEEILHFVEPKDIAGFCSVSKVWEKLCNDNRLWKKNVIAHGWKWWNSPPIDPPSWKKIYMHRTVTDRVVLEHLQNVLDSPRGRIANMLKIAQHGSDAVDVLIGTIDEKKKDHLTRTYYARKILRLLSRQWVVSQWRLLMPMLGSFHAQHIQTRHSTACSIAGVRPTTYAPPFPLEYGAFLLSKFHSYTLDVADVMGQLDALADEARLHVIDPGSTGSGIETRARQLYDFLFVVKGFTGAVQDYYNVENSLIDKVLSRRKGIPITLALLYHAVGRRLGLQIDMIGFPQHFLARIVTEDGSQWFVDCFQQGRNGGFRTREECIDLLSDMRLVTREEYLSPTTDQDFYTRMASNIVAAVHHAPDLEQSTDIHIHAYGAMIVLLLLSGDHTQISTRHPHRRILYGILRADVPEDVWFAEADLAMLRARQTTGDSGMRGTQATLEIAALENEVAEIWTVDGASAPQNVKRRDPDMGRGSGSSKRIPRFHVGETFSHSRYHYSGVIYGWDLVCSADEEWILRMGVDRLEHGRRQPFYNVFALGPDGARTYRYVAEQNIIPGNGDPAMFLAHEEIGKWFERWDNERMVFVPNKELREEYPDDLGPRGAEAQ
ncbi:hemimethylated DNA binding domain-containing protein [Spizellomyces punctatus DAOM BR117]|uniref:Hemimethylated DNA binding domain-containing protein n=1 Tax=Spizellomyces punctatus (strain DAOM BR117) TaxID=645134 RepID=A0A0L0HDR3_SPIPD|nr:hemimethylated DNA binding domain-containing protein [Spizellomyces punctatus DAOM BR117]KNC98908.1 hemimethylated DNA binding domain-containing protein [Spizellomyces punctatus DAOM BR117]|eukprot:XP_016606948.1 hemimethylated DNA binding domain-containing protein [Spizellomyces punctatus DAOM BR117]